MRDQPIRRLERIGREFLAMRPQASDEVRQEALKRTGALKHTLYNKFIALRAGIWPKSGEKYEAHKMDESHFEGAICTAVPAYAYPSFDFGKGKSVKSLLPSDVLSHTKLSPVIAYAKPEPELKK